MWKNGRFVEGGMVHLWNGCGDERKFTVEAFKIRATYHGKAGNGVDMYMIDGQVWFTTDTIE